MILSWLNRDGNFFFFILIWLKILDLSTFLFLYKIVLNNGKWHYVVRLRKMHFFWLIRYPLCTNLKFQVRMQWKTLSLKTSLLLSLFASVVFGFNQRSLFPFSDYCNGQAPPDKSNGLAHRTFIFSQLLVIFVKNLTFSPITFNCSFIYIKLMHNCWIKGFDCLLLFEFYDLCY